ncbi:MAG: hypothetical protein Q9216_004703 [Gyalolechia sp. 2 TL-2023]
MSQDLVQQIINRFLLHITNKTRASTMTNRIRSVQTVWVLATELLETLATATISSLSQTTSAPSSSISRPELPSPNSNIQFDATATAIKRLSAILICPCSDDPDVGLLCIAVNTAILDVYWTLLESCTDPTSLGPSTTNNSSSRPYNTAEWLNSVPLVEDMISNSNNVYPPAETHSKGYNPQSVVRRILDELPKAANLVMQLERRHSAPVTPDAGNEEMASLLPTLAMAQRVTLKGIVQKATGLLGEIP